MQTKTPWTKVVIIGPSQSGKSTFFGQMMVKCDEVDSKTVERYEVEGAQLGKTNSKLIWISDRLKKERVSGMSIEWTLRQVKLENMLYTFIDTPGHVNYIKNFLAGLLNSEAAVLVVSAVKEELDAVMINSNELNYLLIATFVMGVDRIVVLVNKMDAVDYSKERYLEVKAELTPLLK